MSRIIPAHGTYPTSVDSECRDENGMIWSYVRKPGSIRPVTFTYDEMLTTLYESSHRDALELPSGVLSPVDRQPEIMGKGYVIVRVTVDTDTVDAVYNHDGEYRWIQASLLRLALWAGQQPNRRRRTFELLNRYL